MDEYQLELDGKYSGLNLYLAISCTTSGSRWLWWLSMTTVICLVFQPHFTPPLSFFQKSLTVRLLVVPTTSYTSRLLNTSPSPPNIVLEAPLVAVMGMHDLFRKSQILFFFYHMWHVVSSKYTRGSLFMSRLLKSLQNSNLSLCRANPFYMEEAFTYYGDLHLTPFDI